MEIQKRSVLEKQRSGLTHQANRELNLQVIKSAIAVQNLEQHSRQQYLELSSRSQEREASRNGLFHLLAELRDREYAHQETLIRRSGELRKVRFPKAKCVKMCFQSLEDELQS